MATGTSPNNDPGVYPMAYHNSFYALQSLSKGQDLFQTCGVRAMRASIAALAIGICMVPAYAMAQQGGKDANASAPQPDGLGGDIVVTAQRREQRLDKVGLSISAFSSDQMQAMGVQSATELASKVPGVVLESSGGSGLNGNLTMRGVAATDFSTNQESPNAIYFDDIYVSSPYETNFPVYDLERVEILRGPQGTLFGRNSTGGLANFITKKPTEQFEGFVSATIGNYDQKRLEAAVGGPLDDKTQFRISGMLDYSDGWWKNAAGPNTNAQKFFGVRAQIQRDLSDNFKAYFAISYDRNPRARIGTYDSQPAYLVNGTPELLPADVDAYGTGPGNDATGYRDPYPDARKTAFNAVGYLKKERISPTLRLEWNASDEISLISLTNYTHFKFAYAEDCDGTPLNACYFPSGQNLNQWSEELRVSKVGDRFNFTGGVYFLDIKQSNYQNYSFPAYAGTEFAFDISNVFDQHVRSYSAFAQGDYALTDRLKLTVGGRVLHDTKSFSSQVYYNELGDGVTNTVYNPPLLGYDFSEATVGRAAKKKEWLWSGRLQLDYTVSDDALLYASVSRGVKGSGFNSNAGGTTSLAQTPFGAETMIAYEAGSKLKLFDRAVRLNLSTFYYDYSGFQAFQLQGLTSFVTNNDAYMYGGEMELSITPMRGLDLQFGVANLHTKIYDVNTSYSGVIDQGAVNAPKWTVNGLARKSFDIGNGQLAFVYDFSYQSKRYSSVDNNAMNLLPAATLHNARISYSRNGFEIAAFVKNFTNAAKQVSAFDYIALFGTRIVTYVPPRRYGIELRKDF